MSRRAWVAAALLVAVVAGPGPRLAAGAEATLKVSVPVLAYGLYAPFFVAREKGWFKEEGLTLNFIQMPGSTATSALVSGDIDISTSSGSAMNAILQGADLRVIAATNETSPYWIYTTKPEINSLKDLEGKTFGIQARGDSHHEAAVLGLIKAGVNPEKVTLVTLGSGTNRLVGLINKSIDATTLLDAERDQLLQRAAGQAKELADLRKLGVRQHTGGLVVRTDRIAKDRDVFLRFLRALYKGVLFTQKSPDKAVDVWMQAPEIQSVKVSRDVLDSTVRDFFVNSKPLLSGVHSRELQQEIIDVKRRYFLPKAKPDVGPAEVFDFSLVEQAFRQVRESGWQP